MLWMNHENYDKYMCSNTWKYVYNMLRIYHENAYKFIWTNTRINAQKNHCLSNVLVMNFVQNFSNYYVKIVSYRMITKEMVWLNQGILKAEMVEIINQRSKYIYIYM